MKSPLYKNGPSAKLVKFCYSAVVVTFVTLTPHPPTCIVEVYTKLRLVGEKHMTVVSKLPKDMVLSKEQSIFPVTFCQLRPHSSAGT